MNAPATDGPQVIPEALEGERVDRVVSMLFDLPRREAASLVAAGSVRIAGRPVGSRSRRVASGEVLDVTVGPAVAEAPLAPDPGVRFGVVHADEAVIVVDKPAGLVVHPGAGNRSATLIHGLLARYPDLAGVGQPERPGLVHRLDAGTSGLLVVARTAKAYEDLCRQLAARQVERRYLALVAGHLAAPAGDIDAPIGRSATRRTAMAVAAAGRAARTSYEVLAELGEPVEAALLECRLGSGRTHQIRVHLSAIGHPVLGDGTYGRPESAARAAVIGLHRPFLHAHHLAFSHPESASAASFTSPLPPELEEVRARFR